MAWKLQQINAGGVTNAPAAVYDPIVTEFQQQFIIWYRDANGKLCESLYTPSVGWKFEEISGVDYGAATGVPCATVFNNYPHLFCRNQTGQLWHFSWSDRGHAFQQINEGTNTNGPAAAGDPFVSVYNNQVSVVYRDAAGIIQNCYIDGSAWRLQQINGAGGLTNGPVAAGEPFPAVYNAQFHVLYRDRIGTIWDSWFDAPMNQWRLQQINAVGGLTNGPVAVGDPFVFVYYRQFHVLYRDGAGTIWDSWFDAPMNQWRLQQINAVGGLTNGPPAAGDAFVSDYYNQFHVLYRDGIGKVWHSWFDGPLNRWSIEQINGAGGLTNGPAAVGNPFAYAYNQEFHIVYRENTGTIWDSWYYVSPPASRHLQFNEELQLQSEWCWAATTVSITKYYDPAATWTQCELVNRALNQATCCQDGGSAACNQPWYSDQALTITGHLQSVSPSSEALASVMSEIDASRPLSIGIQWFGGGGHNPAIAGYDNSDPVAPTIDIDDPIWGPSVHDFNTFPRTYQSGATWVETCFTK